MKNKNLILITFIALFASTTYAQQGFGTSNPAPSSVIDMVSSNKGALLPRVTLTGTTDTSTIPSPANALTVFNTAAASDVTPGYYYWSTADSKWIRLLDSQATDWHLTGNAGTNPAGGTTTGTDFLGTTDAKDFQIKVGTASNDVMRVTNAKGHTQFGNWLDISVSPNLQAPDRFMNGAAIATYPSNFTVANNFAAADLTGTIVNHTRSAAYVNATSAIPFFSNFMFTQFNNGYTGNITAGTTQVRLDGNATYNTGSQPITGYNVTNSIIGGSNVTNTGGVIGLYANISTSNASTITAPTYAVKGRITTGGTFAGNVIGIQGSMEATTAVYNSGFSAIGTQGSLSAGTFNGTSIGADGIITGGTFGAATSSYGLHSNVSAAGVANGYGLYLDDVAGTVSQHGIYQAGTNDINNFVGNTAIGTTTSPTNTLHVFAASNPVRFEGLQAGAGTDKVVTADATGVLRTVTIASLAPATTNTLTAASGNLISTVNGVASTPAVPVLISASNGLTAASGDVKLGGTLASPTTITTDVTNTLALAGLQTGSTADNVMVADATTGALKKISASSFTNIYTANGTLTGNRIVTMGTNSLGFANGTSRFNLNNTTTDANATLTATTRANMRWAAGTSNLDIFQDSGAVGQIAINGASTGLLIGSALASATPVSLMTNGVTRLTATSTGDIYTTGTWVGIGTSSKSTIADEALRVNGKIRTITNVYADYVFEDYFKGFSELNNNYKFKSLKDTEDFIKKYNHLPGITPITELEKTDKGYSFDISSLTIQNLEKVEELYLHAIEQQKILDAKDKEIAELKKSAQEMNLRLERLEKLLPEQTKIQTTEK